MKRNSGISRTPRESRGAATAAGATPDAAPEATSGATSAAVPAAPPVLQLSAVSHTYQGQRRKTTVLRQIDVSFERGTFSTILGPSGSGKTTLLSLASGLDSPTTGTVRFDGRDIASIGLGRYRNKHAATVFQQYNLLPYMTALQNVVTGMEITGARPATGRRKARALDILAGVGLDPDAAHRNVLKLSGGQQQRVAIARALACDVDILFADEPTGNLDEDTADSIIDIFRDLAHIQHKCVIVVTHSQTLAARSDRTLTLRKGKVTTTRAA
ncbi:ABC transporter ATP-binding protein [Streptomyces sp. NPDC087422]|uniref:ABC transporter ATP-binding protein n=1 Tax=Streptomyces sp. NPDC087422 TaxID=3365786 RepID=UPI00383033D0